jgi:uncharacterized membrane protein
MGTINVLGGNMVSSRLNGGSPAEGSTVKEGGLPIRVGVAVAMVLVGLMAGFFYAYAVSVMVGLARTSDATFIETMQAINATVRNAAFAPAFFGSLVVTGVVAGVAHARNCRTRWWLTVAAILYGAALLITMGISVPLNNELAAAGPVESITDLRAVRVGYEGTWVAWNIVRAVLTTAALAVLVRAVLLARARP